MTASRSDGSRFARIRAWPWRKILPIAALVLLIIAVVPPFRRAALLATSRVILIVATPFAPDIADFKQLSEGAKLLAIDGSVIGTLGDERLVEPVAVAALPIHVKKAVLAAEDKDFYSHSGVDPGGVIRALFNTAKGDLQGGSTITQQLAKINYTAGEKTFLRKFREVLYATKLENRYSKDELLERYINQVYFGEGAYGLGAAAKSFFGVTPDKLSVAQAATLAGKIRSPEGLDPRKDPKLVIQRRDQVLGNMREIGLVEADYKQALAEPLTLSAPIPLGGGRTPHFTEFVKREGKRLDALGGSEKTRASQLFTGGYEIETTLDPKVFDATTAAVQGELGAPEDPTTAAATVVPGDGAIRSLFGGLDFATTQFDMSSLSGRQTGSSFKPFVYMAALRKKIDPRSRFDGTSGRVIPCYGDKPVKNYAGEDAGGLITADDAMVKSVNVVFVDLGCQTGVKAVVDTAVDDGIPEDATTAQGAVFLGGLDGKGVNALEMASAFATFAARGTYAEPYSIVRIKNRGGDVIFERKPETREVFAPDEVGVLNNPLQRVVREGTGRAASIGRPVIGKTGTTQDNIDAWFIGATPQLATGVWVGYAQPKPMTSVRGRSVTGGSFPAAIFGKLMRDAHRDVPVKPIFTASPDSLGLRLIGPQETTTTSSTTTSTTVVTDTLPPGTPDTTATTRPPKPRDTTTTRPTTTTTRPPATTTTAKNAGPASATTTAPP